MTSIFADDFGSKKRRTKKLPTMKKMTLIAAILVFAAVVAGFIFYHFAAQKTDIINTNTRIVAENQGKSPLSSSDKESVREDGNGSVGGDQDSSSGVEDEEARNSENEEARNSEDEEDISSPDGTKKLGNSSKNPVTRFPGDVYLDDDSESDGEYDPDKYTNSP